MTAKKAPAKKKAAPKGIEALPKAGFNVQIQAGDGEWGARLSKAGKKERGRAKTFALAVKWVEDTAKEWE